MKILFNFIIGICLFIYGLQLFSNSIGNTELRIKNILKKYTNNINQSIIIGTIITSIIQSSSIITSLTVALVNANIITFHNSIGIIMGSNLGTCITSWITSILSTSTNFIFTINSTIPLFLSLGLIFYFKNKKTLSNLLTGYGFFIFGLSLMQESLIPITNLKYFKDLIIYLNNPFISLLTGIIITTIIQSSSATISILQIISKRKLLTNYIVIPIILGENIGSCFTTIIASFKTNKNAKKVAYAHLLYNVIGTIIFLILFYLLKYLNKNYLCEETNSYQIALIHTLFNFFSIIIFYPFINYFEKFINKIKK